MSGQPESDQQDNQGGAPEDIKAKFREALDKKSKRQHPHEQAAPGESKADGEHNRADHDKTFRRKSG